MDGYWNVNFACKGSAGSPMRVRMTRTVGASVRKEMISTSPPQRGHRRGVSSDRSSSGQTQRGGRPAGKQGWGAAPGKDLRDGVRAMRWATGRPEIYGGATRFPRGGRWAARGFPGLADRGGGSNLFGCGLLGGQCRDRWA